MKCVLIALKLCLATYLHQKVIWQGDSLPKNEWLIHCHFINRRWCTRPTAAWRRWRSCQRRAVVLWRHSLPSSSSRPSLPPITESLPVWLDDDFSDQSYKTFFEGKLDNQLKKSFFWYLNLQKDAYAVLFLSNKCLVLVKLTIFVALGLGKI